MNRRCWAIIVLLIFLTGCGNPVFQHPLAAPEDSQSLPELHGSFRAVNPDNGTSTCLHIGPCNEEHDFPAGFLNVIMVQETDVNQAMGQATFVVFGVPVDDSLIMHIPVPDGSNLESQMTALGHRWNDDIKCSYELIRLKQIDDGFELYLANWQAFAEAIESGKLSSETEKEDAELLDDPPQAGHKLGRVTASSEELSKFFRETPLDRVFEVDGPVFRKLNRK